MKMFTFAALAVVAAMAFIAASSASADPDTEVVFCKANEVLCLKSNILPPQKFKSTAVNPVLKGTLEVKCPESVANGETLEEMGAHLALDITTLTFGPAGKCSGCSEVDTRTTEAKGPYQGTVLVDEKDDYLLNTAGSARLLHCTIFNLTCEFGAESVQALIDNTASGLPEILFKAAVLSYKAAGSTGSEALCGKTGTWTATYKITEPDPVYLALYLLEGV